MTRQKRALSADDQKAIDIILDHAANGDKGRITRLTNAASPASITAATQLLSLLNELPEVQPPLNLVAETMKRIDAQSGGLVGHRLHRSVAAATHVH